MSGSGDRRHLTVMFVDLVGSTELSVRLDPEEMREVFRAYQVAVTHEVERFGGYVAKLMGDGMLVYFGWPRLHEHGAERAARAGVAAVAAVGRLITPAPGPLAARVGIASGMVVVGETIGEGSAREVTVVGETPSLAARLQTVAPVGGILVSEATRPLLAGQFELAPLGELTVKGFAEPTPAWRIIGEAPRNLRFTARTGSPPSAMIGRDRELVKLQRAWRRAARGEGQAILVEGEAGIGKSRLVHALRTSISARPHEVVAWQCSPFHSETPLWPALRELLGDEPVPTLARLRQRLARAGVAAAQAVPIVASALGIASRGRYSSPEPGAESQPSQLLGLLVDRLTAIAAVRPLLLVTEDLQWADATTLDLLRLLLPQVASLPMLVLMTCQFEKAPGIEVSQRLMSIRLGPLDESAIIAIVTGPSAGITISPAAAELIARRANGVPLFAEELARNGTGDSVPPSLHDMLLAPLDQFPAAKELVQVAACMGHEFDATLLASVSDWPDAELRRTLRQLCAVGILLRREGARYQFRQALMQDAVHESLLKSRRRELHARLLAAIEQRGDPELAERAGDHAAAAELWAKALHHHGVAGKSALDQGATDEGLALVDKALQAGHRLGGDITAEVALIELRRARSWAHLRRGETPRVMADLRDAETSAGRLGIKRLNCQLRAQRTYVEGAFGGHAWRAVRYGREAVRIAEAVADRELLTVARFALGQSYQIAGDQRAAIAELEADVEAYRSGSRMAALGSGGTLAVEGLAVLGDCLGQLGRWDEALALGAESRAIAAKTSLPWDSHIASYHLARTLLARGDAAAAEPLIEEGLALGRRGGLAAVTTMHRALLAGAKLIADQPQEAVELLDQAIADCDAMRLQWAHAHAAVLKAEACLALGRDDAPAVATEALELAQAHGYRAFEAAAQRLYAGCIIGADPAGAGERLHAADEIAERLALPLERMAIAGLAARIGPTA